MPLVTMQAKGQMTVPQALREALGIETGTQLVCFQTGPDAFECHVLPKPMSVDELIERFSSPDPVPTPEEMHAIVRDGILAETRAEEGWTDESWEDDAHHLVGRSRLPPLQPSDAHRCLLARLRGTSRREHKKR